MFLSLYVPQLYPTTVQTNFVKFAVSALEGESSDSGTLHQSSYEQQQQRPHPQPYTANTTSSSHMQPTPGQPLQPDQQLSWQQQSKSHPQQQQQVSKLNTSAKSADSVVASSRGQSSAIKVREVPQDDPVDSWEDIADSADTTIVGMADGHVPAKKPAQQDSKTIRVINQTDAQSSSKSSPGSAQSSNKESGNQSSLATETTPSGSNGNGKKHPSPNMSEKKPGRSESKQAAAAAMQLPPPKTEDDKENLNIVFIGHVGK